MSEENLVQFCAPTLAGLKTGNLFGAEYRSPQEVRQQVRQLNRILVPRGLRAVPLCYGKRRAQIYVYRPSYLSRDLRNQEARRLLKELGYRQEDPSQCLRELVRRLQPGGEFPHEIGLFLGYPPEDVRGFMEHGAADCKCVGCWKVYGDEEAARKTFHRYKKCTEVYCKKWRCGATFQQLIVAG